VKIHFTKAKVKYKYKVKMMIRYGAELTRKTRTKCKNRIGKRKPKEEHIYELNRLTMEGKA